MIVTSVPGKLYIAGEYAVMEPGYPAILVAVNQFITVTLEKAQDEGSIRIYEGVPILWTRDQDKLIFYHPDNRLIYITEAINIVEAYAKELGRELSYYHLKVASQLENSNGIKYGLGSSAAVTVATVEALCQYYDIPLSNDKLFKLSSLASLAVNSNGSCGDIAACVYGGWIAFTTFDKFRVQDYQNNMSIDQLINLQWPGLSIEQLMPADDLKLVVGWTGIPASTAGKVYNFNQKRRENNILYKKFLEESKLCVTKMINAFKDNNIKEIQKQIKINRELLVKMSENLDMVVETTILSKLCDIALKYNGFGKSSGAGGGDCGIVIFNNNQEINKLIDEWEASGITNLPLKVYERGEDKFD